MWNQIAFTLKPDEPVAIPVIVVFSLFGKASKLVWFQRISPAWLHVQHVHVLLYTHTVL